MINTGAVGNIDDITIQDSANIIKAIAKNNISWKKCTDWNYMIPFEVNEVATKKLDPKNYFSTDEYSQLTNQLKEERINWLNKFKDLKDTIKNIFN